MFDETKTMARLFYSLARTLDARRLGALVLCAATVTSSLGCEPMDEAPPPRTPVGVTVPPPEPPQAPPSSAAASEPSPPPPPVEQPPSDAPPSPPSYASGEYTIGEDTDSYDDSDPAALTDFRQTLDPYGSWSDDPTYGTIWTPSPSAVGPDFQPYVSAGHWTYDDDYTWVSDYPWGWAPFHYGRWIFIDGRGWAWVPGREYRGAWVNWSVDDGYGYLGWAPAPPLFIWVAGAPVWWHGYWGPRWAYCPRGAVFAPRVGASVIVGPAAVAIAPRMRPYGGIGARVAVGPPPARFGYAPAAIPRAAAAPTVAHAREFARPSTAQPMGARPPTARMIATPAVRGGYDAPRAGYAARPAFPPNNVARTQPVPYTPGTARAVPGVPARPTPVSPMPYQRPTPVSPGFQPRPVTPVSPGFQPRPTPVAPTNIPRPMPVTPRFQPAPAVRPVTPQVSPAVRAPAPAPAVRPVAPSGGFRGPSGVHVAPHH